VFGEMALLDDQPRSADAVCLEPCTLLVIGSGEFHHLMARTPDLGCRVLTNLGRTLSERLRRTDAALEWHPGRP
jgi:CRP-like cAMP-binding protein